MNDEEYEPLEHVANILEKVAADYRALRAENARLLDCYKGSTYTVDVLIKDNAKLREALNRLVNEVSGSWSAFEFVLRQELGNTNYACVKDKLEAARAEIGESDGN